MATLAAALTLGLFLAAAPQERLVLSEPVHHMDAAPAREPMIVEHPAGDIFLTGYAGDMPRLWRSGDRGATWRLIDVDTARNARGNSDVDLAVAPDGTLYFVVMTFDGKKGEGVAINIGRSRDVGKTWTWTELSRTRFDDRPWVKVAPDGTAHVIWNDGEGVAYVRSRDRGATWQEQPRIHPQGHSSHMAIGPSGEIAVRITPVSASGNKNHPGVELLAVSTDGGTTWQKRQVPGKREFTYPLTEDDPMPRWVEPLAWDAAGRLYYLWTDPAGLWLARSTSRGAEWTTWQVAKGGELRYFPYLIARGKGELAATWFSGRRTRMQAHVARLSVSDDDAPRLTEAPPFAPESWARVQKPGEPRSYDPAGEYLPIMFLRDGRLAIATAIQDVQGKRFGFTWRTAEVR